MAAFGASFHWMDRGRVANLLSDILESDGSLVLLGSPSFHRGTSAWEATTLQIVEDFVGKRRRAGAGFYEPGDRHEQVLASSPFSRLTDRTFDVHEMWSVDEVVGYLYSTSFASSQVLGPKLARFEREIRSALAPLCDNNGLLSRRASYSAVVARRS